MRDRSSKIVEPIFVVGCGRSGTTLLYDILCRHHSLAWISSVTDRFPLHPQMAVLNNLYPMVVDNFKSYRKTRLLPKPDEGYRTWDHCKPLVGDAVDRPLKASDLTEQDADRVESVILGHLKFQRKSRFINKNTRNSRRIEWLHQLFPNALFIHLVRDPLPVVSSFLRVNWWDNLPIWCENGVTPEQWRSAGKGEHVLAANLWKAETEIVLDAAEFLEKNYLRLSYQDLVNKPSGSMEKILEFCKLDKDPAFIQRLSSIIFEDVETKYLKHLSPTQIKEVEGIAADTLERLADLDRKRTSL